MSARSPLAHKNTAVPFNQDGPDRMCGCGARAVFFRSAGRDHVTGLPIIKAKWCGRCPAAPGWPARWTA